MAPVFNVVDLYKYLGAISCEFYSDIARCGPSGLKVKGSIDIILDRCTAKTWNYGRAQWIDICCNREALLSFSLSFH